jgi:hypothetical protein
MSRQCADRRSIRRGRIGIGASPPGLYDYTCQPQLRIGRPPKHDLETWTVTDDWPTRVPVTDAEVDVFEAWFGDLFDELFGQCR